MRVGPYRVIETLAEGSKTSTFRAVLERRDDTTSDESREVVVRLLHRSLEHDAVARGTLLREAWIGERLRHPLRAGARAIGHEAGRPYLLLEWVPGDTLETILERTGGVCGLDLEWSLRVVRDLLGVVSAAHKMGFVHGVLSPAKVIVRADGSVRVLDCDAAPRSKSMIAEQAPDLLDQETRPDVVSCGLLLHSMLSGRRVHAMRPPRAVVEEAALQATQLARAPDAAPAVVELVTNVLFGGARRPRTAQDFADAITGVLDLLLIRRALLATLAADGPAIVTVPPVSGVFGPSGESLDPANPRRIA